MATGPTTQHYVWAAGHFLLLVCATKYLLAWLTFRSAQYPRYYSLSYTGALISYAIVCYKSHLSQGLGSGGVQSLARRFVTDENFQYFALALFWWMSKPVPVSLIPFATFSLFHALTFLRSNILPHFFPPTPSAAAGQPATPHPFMKKVQGWIKANYDPAMRLVAYAELMILLRVVAGAITLQNSLLTPILYAHFLRTRYQQSPFTQRAIAHFNGLVDGFIRSPGKPPMLVGIWDKVQTLVASWAGLPPTAQAAGAPGAGAARR